MKSIHDLIKRKMRKNKSKEGMKIIADLTPSLIIIPVFICHYYYYVCDLLEAMRQKGFPLLDRSDMTTKKNLIFR